jgi:hypothetical protein
VVSVVRTTQRHHGTSVAIVGVDYGRVSAHDARTGRSTNGFTTW